MNIDEFIARSNDASGEGDDARSRTAASDPRRRAAQRQAASSQRRTVQAPRQRQDFNQQGGGRPKGSFLLIALLLVAAAVLGFLLFRYVFGGGGGSLSTKLQLSEGELNHVVATYTMMPGSYDNLGIARLIYQLPTTLCKMFPHNEDGSYDAPSADAILACVRGIVVAKEAERQGLTVSEADVAAYAQSTLGTSDYASIASGYGQTEEEVHAQLSEAALMAQLRAKVMTEAYPEAPAMPQEPAVGEELSLTEGYANYVLGLAASEWDSETGTWVSPDGPFASALADYEISASGASHEAALQAYWVAYQDYVTNHAEAAKAWDAYLNGLLSGVKLELGSVAV